MHACFHNHQNNYHNFSYFGVTDVSVSVLIRLNPNDGIYTPLLRDEYEIAHVYESYRKQRQGCIDCKVSPTAICENCSGMDETCQMTNSDHDDCEMGRTTSENGGVYITHDDEYSDIEYTGIASTSFCDSMQGSYKIERIKGNKEKFPGMILNKEHQYDQDQDDNDNYDDIDDDDDNDDDVYDAVDDDDDDGNDNDYDYAYAYENDDDEEDNYDDGGGGDVDDKHDANVNDDDDMA